MAATHFSGPVVSAAGFVSGSDTGPGIISGAVAPTGITATKGTLYINTAASSTTTRLYINTDGGTTWANFTASA